MASSRGGSLYIGIETIWRHPHLDESLSNQALTREAEEPGQATEQMVSNSILEIAMAPGVLTACGLLWANYCFTVQACSRESGATMLSHCLKFGQKTIHEHSKQMLINAIMCYNMIEHVSTCQSIQAYPKFTKLEFKYVI